MIFQGVAAVAFQRIWKNTHLRFNRSTLRIGLFDPKRKGWFFPSIILQGLFVKLGVIREKIAFGRPKLCNEMDPTFYGFCFK